MLTSAQMEMSPGVMLMPVIIVVGLLRRHKKRRRNTMKYTGSIIWGWPQNTFATLGVWKQMKRLQAWYTHTHGMARIIYSTSKPPGWTARSSDRPERTSSNLYHTCSIVPLTFFSLAFCDFARARAAKKRSAKCSATNRICHAHEFSLTSWIHPKKSMDIIYTQLDLEYSENIGD